MTTQSGIYRIRCTATDKIYIGSSADIEKRWKEHRVMLRQGRHHSRYLQSSWDKYGADAFLFEVVESLDPEQLLDREQQWIDETQCYDPALGYNVAPTTGGGARVATRPDDGRRDNPGRPEKPYIERGGTRIAIKLPAATLIAIELIAVRRRIDPRELVAQLVEAARQIELDAA